MSVTLEQYQATQTQINNLRNQLLDFNGKVAKLEGQVKIMNVKCSAYEKQLAKKVSENKELIALLQKQQNQKLTLLLKDRELTYNQSRGEMEARRNQNLLKSLNQQLQRLKGEIANSASQKMKWYSQKQQLSNKLLIVEQKYKACKNMEEIIGLLKNSLSITSKENDQLKSQLGELKKKMNAGGQTQKTTITNKNQVIDELLRDFQQKLNAKQRTIGELRESYEKKIADLNLTIALAQNKNQKYL